MNKIEERMREIDNEIKKTGKIICNQVNSLKIILTQKDTSTDLFDMEHTTVSIGKDIAEMEKKIDKLLDLKVELQRLL